jgi:hypothetical protein
MTDWEAADSARIRLAGAAFTTTLYHHQAIIRLIDEMMYPSASALVRPLYDAGLCGLWIEHCASDSELDVFVREARRPKSETMAKRIEKNGFIEGNQISSIKNMNWSYMSDYTHCGSRMLDRMNGKDYIGPNF